MAVQNPPDGMAQVMPYLLYEDLEASVEWLEKAFGLEERVDRRVPGPNGKTGHTEMHLGKGVILMGHPGPDYQNPKHSGSRHQLLYVYVDDIEAHYRQARAAGAEVQGELEDAFYGDRRYSALDPEGHEWTFAQPMKEPQP